MNIDFVTSTQFEKLVKKDSISKAIVSNFCKKVKVFVTATLGELMEKSAIGSIVVRNASVLDPKLIRNSANESLINTMKVH